jgi:hypothetical protein
LNEESVTGFPSVAGRVKSGAISPTFSVVDIGPEAGGAAHRVLLTVRAMAMSA